MTRHAQIDGLISRASALTVTLENAAPTRAEELFATIEGVTGMNVLRE